MGDLKVLGDLTIGNNYSVQSMDVDDIRNSRLNVNHHPALDTLTETAEDELHVQMESHEVDFVNDQQSSSDMSSSSFGSRANHVYGTTEMPNGLLGPQMTTQGGSIDDIHGVPMPPLPPMEEEEKEEKSSPNANPYHHEFEQLSGEIMALQVIFNENEDVDNVNEAPMSPKELDDAFDGLKDDISEMLD